MTKDKLLNSTLEDLNGFYTRGLYEFLFKHKKELFSQLQAIESKIDNAFLNGTLDELRQVLREYWTLHLRAIQIFKNYEITDFDREEVRQEMLEGRVSS